MPLEFCNDCKSMHYTTDACRPKKLERAIPQEQVESDDNSKPAARSNTPKPKRDRNEYLRVYMRDVYRPKIKARKAVQ